MNLLLGFYELPRPIKVSGGFMTTILVIRIIMAVVLMGFAFLMQFLAELFQRKPSRHEEKVLHPATNADPSLIAH